jgi:hypothetical protein
VNLWTIEYPGEVTTSRIANDTTLPLEQTSQAYKFEHTDTENYNVQSPYFEFLTSDWEDYMTVDILLGIHSDCVQESGRQWLVPTGQVPKVQPTGRYHTSRYALKIEESAERSKVRTTFSFLQQKLKHYCIEDIGMQFAQFHRA